MHLEKSSNKKFAETLFELISYFSKNFFIFFAYIKLCLTDLDIKPVSLRDSIAANCATSFILNGGFILFKALIIFLSPYHQPTLKDARPYIFENVLNIKTLFLFLNNSKPDL